MPQAPRYGDPRVQQDPLRPRVLDPGVSPETFGGGRAGAQVFDAARGVNQDVQRIAMAQQERWDANRLSEERRALNDWEIQNVSAAKKKLGKDALTVPDEISGGFDKFVAERQKGLANEAQRQQYAQMADARRMHVTRWAQDHLDQQSAVVEENEIGAAIASSKNRAAADPSVVPLEVQMVDDNVRKRAARQGWLSDQTEYEIAKEKSDLHFGVLGMMLNSGNDLSAKDYYTAHKDDLVGDDARRAAAMVKRESTLGTAQREVDKIFTNYVDWNTKEEHAVPTSEEAAMEEARKIQDPDVRAQAEQLTRQRWAGVVRSREEARKQGMVEAANEIDSGKKFTDLSAELRDSLSPTDRKTLMNYAKGEKVTDDAQWYALNLMAAHEGTRGAFKNLNLYDYVDKFSKGDFQELVKLQAGLIKDDAKAKKDADGFRTTAGIVSGTIMGKIPEKEHESFLRVINDKVRQWQSIPANKDKDIPDREIQEMTDNLLKEVIKPGVMGWTWGPFGTKEKAYASQSRIQQFMTDNIPKTDRDFIISDFKRHGIVWDDLMLGEAYSKLLQQRAGAKSNAGK